MAIRRKGEKEAQGVPTTLVKMTERAATFYTTKEFFDTQYKREKAKIEEYLDTPDCPVNVSVGAGGGVKVLDIGSLSFSQPERVDNGAAVAAIVEALKNGTLQPDALTEVISTVSREGLEKVLPATAKEFVKTSDKVVVTLRAKSEFKAAVNEKLLKEFPEE